MDGEHFGFGPVPVRPPGGEPGQDRSRSPGAPALDSFGSLLLGLAAISTATRRAAGPMAGDAAGASPRPSLRVPGPRPWCTCYSVRRATTPSRRARRSHLTHGHGPMTRPLPRSPSPLGPLVVPRLRPLFDRSKQQQLPSRSAPQAGLDAAGRRPLSFFSHATFVAPSGTSPRSRYFHSAINSFRANATIPTFRDRALPSPNRR
jgi:hypothetical protein